MGKLTAKQVHHAKPGKHYDERGLFLHVQPTGSGQWKVRVQAGGVRRDYGLGGVLDVSLAEARSAAEDIRKMIRTGKNPTVERKALKKSDIPTFKEAAEAVIAENAPAWKSAKHLEQWRGSFANHVYPYLGDTPVDQIDQAMIRDVVAKCWMKIPATARRVLHRTIVVMETCYVQYPGVTDMSVQQVKRGLAKQPKNRKNYSSMPWRDVPAFIATMRENGGAIIPH